jgi:hypothetical protein
MENQKQQSKVVLTSGILFTGILLGGRLLFSTAPGDWLA